MDTLERIKELELKVMNRLDDLEYTIEQILRYPEDNPKPQLDLIERLIYEIIFTQREARAYGGGQCTIQTYKNMRGIVK